MGALPDHHLVLAHRATGSAASVARRLSALAGFFSYGLYDAAAQSLRSAALVTLLACCGLCISEALGADVCNYGSDAGHRFLRITRKGSKSARVPLAPPVVRALDASPSRPGHCRANPAHQ